jgi:hypothetical protein
MLVVNKKQFTKGVSLGISFFVVLAIMFSPMFKGENAFKASDRLFNSIAKGSSFYIPKIVEQNSAFLGSTVETTVALKSKETAQTAEAVLTRAGAQVSASDTRLRVTGDLGAVVKASLEDSEAMFNNRGAEVSAKYGSPEKEVLVTWWNVFKEMEKDLKKQQKFKEAAFLEEVMKKGIEVGYNFYGIDPEKAVSKAGILSLSLIFYVIYTLWWGYSILFIFDGLGLEMKASARKEV